MPPHMLLPGTEHRGLLVRLWLTMIACLRALVELARARWVFAARPVSEILRGNGGLPGVGAPGEPARIAAVGFAVTRMARRVPWRADCLVQAMAAQHWLAQHGVASTIAVGSLGTGNRDFSAHAWLVCGDTVVTGGDVSPYAVLVGPEITRP